MSRPLVTMSEAIPEKDSDGFMRNRWYITLNGNRVGAAWEDSIHGPSDTLAWFKSALDDLGLTQDQTQHGDSEEEVLSLLQIQCQQKPWRVHNFGEGEAIEPLMGLCEEVGELVAAHMSQREPENGRPPYNDSRKSPEVYYLLLIQAYVGQIMHATLKTIQGIRGSGDDHLAKALENLSYLKVAAYRLQDELTGVKVNRDHEQVLEIPELIDPSPQDAVADVLIYACDYATLADPPFNIQQVTSDTWKKVRQRDFKKHQKTGVEEGAV